MTTDCLITAVHMLELWRAAKPDRNYTINRDPRATDDDRYDRRPVKPGDFLLGAIRVWVEDADGSVDGGIFWDNEDVNSLGTMLTKDGVA